MSTLNSLENLLEKHKEIFFVQGKYGKRRCDFDKNETVFEDKIEASVS